MRAPEDASFAHPIKARSAILMGLRPSVKALVLCLSPRVKSRKARRCTAMSRSCGKWNHSSTPYYLFSFSPSVFWEIFSFLSSWWKVRFRCAHLPCRPYGRWGKKGYSVDKILISPTRLYCHHAACLHSPEHSYTTHALTFLSPSLFLISARTRRLVRHNILGTPAAISKDSGANIHHDIKALLEND
jgi:hypothetical protein